MKAGVHLVLRQRPGLRLDLRGILPALLATLDDAAIGALPIGRGAGQVPLGDCFSLQRFDAEAPTLRIGGDGTARLDRIGWGLATGVLQVQGDAGDHAGALMAGGALHIAGSAGLLAGCQMAGGRLAVAGDVGDWAASGLPGSMDGMRGGLFTVGGHAGARLADRMRRGTLLVCGDVADFCASRLVAGTVVVGGRVGRHPGYGQRRGSLLLLGATAQSLVPPDTFVPAGAEAPVAWQLLAHELATLQGLHPPLADLPRQLPRRWLGDRAAEGKGEWLLL